MEIIMRDINRIEPLLARLQEVWKRYPDLRLSQLILNVEKDPKIYYMEDEELIELLEQFYV